MAEDEAIFDSSLKKKKKKKKPLDFDTIESEPTPNEVTNVVQESTNVVQESTNVVQESADPAPEEYTAEKNDDLEDFSIKKKKKKKKVKPPVIMDDVSETPEEIEGNKENSPDISGDKPLPAEDDDAGIDFSKKKKRLKKIKFHEKEHTDSTDSIKDMSGTAWAGTERDYTYSELLTRAFDIMRAKNPDMATGEKKRFVMRPPQVVRVGTKKSSFVNFMDICKMLHRPPEHLLAFLLAELGTSGSIDGHNQLIIKGRFQQKQIENVLRRYIKEYVTCHTCRSSDTFLHKENRLFFLQCERCQSRCSVQSIKSGFQAVTGKRAQLRAKAN